jgi:hypothetical protein
MVGRLPYEELAAEYDRKLAELSQMRSDLESGAELETNPEARLAIKSLCAIVSELSPRREKEAEELAEKRIKQLDDESKTELWERLKAKKAELEDLQLLFEENCGPWEVPLLYVKEKCDGTDGLLFEDEIPVEPELRTVEDPLPTDFVERHIDAPEATQRLAYYFKENQGQVTGVRKLIEYLYSQKTIEETPTEKLRSRVTTLLGPGKNGIVVRNVMKEEDIEFQWGWRRLIETEDGRRKIVRTTRIYRSYPVGQKPMDLREDVPEKQEFIWEEEGIKSEPIEGKVGTAIVRRAVEASQPVAEYDAESDRVIVLEPDQSDDKKVELKVEKPDKWTDFRLCVRESVAKLVEREVILSREEPVRLNIVKAKSGSRSMGTQTSIDRMSSTRLINRHMSVDDVLSPDLIVAMDLFNSQRGKFSRSQQDKAMAIIQEELDSLLGGRG